MTIQDSIKGNIYKTPVIYSILISDGRSSSEKLFMVENVFTRAKLADCSF